MPLQHPVRYLEMRGDAQDHAAARKSAHLGCRSVRPAPYGHQRQLPRLRRCHAAPLLPSSTQASGSAIQQMFKVNRSAFQPVHKPVAPTHLSQTDRKPVQHCRTLQCPHLRCTATSTQSPNIVDHTLRQSVDAKKAVSHASRAIAALTMARRTPQPTPRPAW